MSCLSTIRPAIADAAQFLYVERGLYAPSWFLDQPGFVITRTARIIRILEGFDAPDEHLPLLVTPGALEWDAGPVAP